MQCLKASESTNAIVACGSRAMRSCGNNVFAFTLLVNLASSNSQLQATMQGNNASDSVFLVFLEASGSHILASTFAQVGCQSWIRFISNVKVRVLEPRVA